MVKPYRIHRRVAGSPWLESSFHNWNFLLEEPVRFADGYAYAPEFPGHGLRISEQARERFAQPTIVDLRGVEPPPSPIRITPD